MSSPPPLMEMINALIAAPSISSVSPRFDMGNLEVSHLLAAWLEDLGFRTRVIPVTGHRDKANVIATLGSGDRGLVLSGHSDTVPYDEGRWRFDPFKATVSEGRIYGLGTSDMKAFLALAVESAREIRAGSLKCPLTILATADEESGMDGALQLTPDQIPARGQCLIGEPTGLVPVRQHKGIFMESIQLQGRSGHSSDPRYGNSALEGMVQVMDWLMDYRRQLAEQYCNTAFDVPVPTLNLGHIHGGDNPNRICGACELHLDLRPLPGMEIEPLRKTIRENAREIAESRGLEARFEALFAGVPAMETPAGAQIVRLAEEVTGTPSAAVAFCTEGPYFNRMGMQTVVLGPGDIEQAHQPDEFLSLDRIEPTLGILERLITRLCME